MMLGLAQNFPLKANSYTIGFRQSKTAVSTGLFSHWSVVVLLLIVSRVEFTVFVLFLEAVGVREYCCMAVENRLAALCFARSARATRAHARRTLVPANWWLWAYSRKPPKLRTWICTQPTAAKATAGVAGIGKMGLIPRSVAVV